MYTGEETFVFGFAGFECESSVIKIYPIYCFEFSSFQVQLAQFALMGKVKRLDEKSW